MEGSHSGFSLAVRGPPFAPLHGPNFLIAAHLFAAVRTLPGSGRRYLSQVPSPRRMARLVPNNIATKIHVAKLSAGWAFDEIALLGATLVLPPDVALWRRWRGG